MAKKFGDALALIAEGDGLIYAVAGSIGAALAPITGGSSLVAMQIAAGYLSAFVNIFIFSCLTFIPAILDEYIPSDSVCPEGYWNIHDAIAGSTGSGEFIWQLISNIPGFGDALGTFGPYICTNPEGKSILKKPALIPAYYYDSTLSLYADMDKDNISQDESRFSDRRQYITKSGDYDPPIWVDFADTTMINKMANYYYKMARSMAQDNGDGTYTFSYITRFYGVTTSSIYSCDVQCEITEVTIYASTGIEALRVVVPVDPSYGSTYHDRRFYFYPIQVDINPTSQDPASISARTIEAYYSKKDNLTFLTGNLRRSALTTKDNNALNNLMIDNMKRYIVTACTHEDGTGVAAQEVNGEGDYVGDALISLGDSSSAYNPPELSMNTPFQFDLQAVITDPVNISGTSYKFTYNNPIKTFLPPGRKSDGTASTGDKVRGISIPIDSNYIIQRSDETWTLDINNPALIDSFNRFEGEILSYSEGSIQEINIKDITWVDNTHNPNTLMRYIIVVKTRSNIEIPPLSPPQCNAFRGRLYNASSITLNNVIKPVTPSPSRSILDRSVKTEIWDTAASFGHIRYGNPLKIWKEVAGPQMVSDTQRNLAIIQGTILGIIAYRVMWNKSIKGETIPIPIGAMFTQGLLGMNYDGTGSVLDMISCTYTDSTDALGTFVRNANIITIDIGDSIDNHYRIINRGPTIRFAPGYSCELSIDKSTLQMTQVDCVNRRAVRYAVNKYNTANTGVEFITKLLSVETDTTNKQCMYLFETTNNSRTIINKKASIVKYELSSNKYVYIPKLSTNPTTYTHNIDGTMTPVPSFDLTLAQTSILPPGVTDSFNTINSLPAGAEELSVSDPSSLAANKQKLAKITRPAATDNKRYTCASPEIYSRLMMQFNLKYNGSPTITNILNSYYPATGSIKGDGTIQCVYKAQVKMTTFNDLYSSISDLNTYYLTMIAVPANDINHALYDLVYDSYPSGHIYQPVPVPGNWIAIPPPLPKSTSISRGTSCDPSFSTCSKVDIIANLVSQFNIQHVNGKILKVRKAYTPLISGSNVCDYEVEMLRQIPDSHDTLIQKESIRLPIVGSSTDPCMWDLNMVGSNIPVPDTGLSLTNSAAVEMLSTPYIWAPSFLSNVRNTINGALLNYLNIDIKGVLSNTAMNVKNNVQTIYDTVASEQTLYHPDSVNNSNCHPKCKDTNILQAIIDRYYADNYPTSQYGVQKRKMVEVRRAGTFNSNICQVEFIEQVDTYSDFILPPIHVTDPTNSNAPFNTKYYLRQYEFPVQDRLSGCQFGFSNIQDIASSNDFSSIDLSGNAIAIMSDFSALTASDNAALNFSGKYINCAATSNIQSVIQLYNSGINSGLNKIQTITKAFNQGANVCEYYAPQVNVMLISGSSSAQQPQDRIIQATWNDYNTTTGPSDVQEFGSQLMTRYVEYGNYVYRLNSDNSIVKLPYLYEVIGNPSVLSNVDTSRVVTTSIALHGAIYS